jgi:23S rRNA G2069 N7-methylase RlmK/C1962 C5-methylase RlmI
VSVDFYNSKLVVSRYFNKNFHERDELRFVEVLSALKSVLSVEDSDIFVKERQRQKGIAQYEKVSEKTILHTVHEGSLKFLVNLSDYLDTGLFLDHRLSRRWMFENANGKRVLNLFCYTGSVSVHAAAGGASHVTSVDLSSKYLRWAEENMQLNGIDIRGHDFIRDDVCLWLKSTGRDKGYDIIFLDPPSFSNSKKMHDIFDVQRDHRWMVERCMSLLNPGGVLFFSNNLRSFKLDSDLGVFFNIRDITKKTLPVDFRNEMIHRAWLIENKPGV